MCEEKLNWRGVRDSGLGLATSCAEDIGDNAPMSGDDIATFENRLPAWFRSEGRDHQYCIGILSASSDGFSDELIAFYAASITRRREGC